MNIKLEGIFIPHLRQRRDDLYCSGAKPFALFVHYTSADAALSIIKSKRMWLRNTTCMSDYREVQHGFDLLKSFVADPQQTAKFQSTLDMVAENLAGEALQLFGQWWDNIRLRTYIASVSEHGDKEDMHGRLSMWRAFGGTPARVAIVFRVPWFTGAESELNAIFSPVAYLQEAQVCAHIANVLENVERKGSFSRRLIARRSSRGSLVCCWLA